MQRLPVETRDLLMALLMGQVVKRVKGPLTLLVIGGNLGLGLALLYRLAALKPHGNPPEKPSNKAQPAGTPRLKTAFWREATSSPRTPSDSTTPSSR